jgi:hypothetical protein
MRLMRMNNISFVERCETRGANKQEKGRSRKRKREERIKGTDE